MPFLTADITDEHDGLAVFTQQQVHQVGTTLRDLDREQLAARSTVSVFTPGTLARHVLAVVTGFAAEIRAATAVAEGRDPVGAVGGTAALSGDDAGSLRPTDTAETLIEELTAAADELAAAVRDADLDAPVPVPPAPWFSGEERWTVRWVALHCVEEVARHAGHADLLRESIDGKGAYELNAHADGQEWPPPGW